MGMRYFAASVSADVLASVQADPEPFRVSELVYGGLDLDKNWAVADVLITAQPLGSSPLLFGSSSLGDDLWYGPASVHSPDEVRALVDSFVGVDEAELRRRFDPAALDAEGVYPMCWRNEPADMLEDISVGAALQLMELFRSAAAAGNFVVSLLE